MAVYRYGDEEYNDSLSANRIRIELERSEQARRELDRRLESERLNDAAEQKRKAEEEKKRRQERESRHNFFDRALTPKSNDQISAEIRANKEDSSLIGNYAKGFIASIDSMAKKNYQWEHTAEAINDAQKIQQIEIETHVNDSNEKQTRKLSELNRDLDHKIEKASALSQTYYVEYVDKSKEAAIVKQKANEYYEHRTKSIDRNERDADRKYQKVIAITDNAIQDAGVQLKKETQEFTENRDKKIQQAETSYQKTIAEIKQNYSGQERDRRLKSAEEQKIKVVADAEKTYKQNIDSSKEAYEQKVTSANREREVATEKHNQKLQTFAIQRDEALRKRDETLNRNLIAINEAQIKYTKDKAAVNQELTNAQMRRDNYMANAAVVDTRNQYIAEKESIKVFRPSGKQSEDGSRLVETVLQNHDYVAKKIINAVGTREEKSLLAKVEADNKARDTATKKGELFSSTLTEEDKKAYAKMMIKTVGDISTENNVKSSTNILSLQTEKIKNEINKNTQLLKTHNDDIKAIDKQIAALNQELKPITAAKELLATGRNAEGKKINSSEKNAALRVLHAAGPTDKKQADLNALVEKREKMAGKAQSLAAKIDSDKSTLATTTAHSAILNKHGALIADTVRETKTKFYDIKKVDKNASLGNKILGHSRNAINIAKMEVAAMVSKDVRKQKFEHREAVRNTGESEKAIKARQLAQQRVRQSSDILKKRSSLLLQKDNAIHYELMSQGKNTRAFVKKTEERIKIAQKAHVRYKQRSRNMKILGIGDKLKAKDEKLAKLLGKNNPKIQAIGKKVGQVGKGTVNVGVGIVTAPGKIAALPNRILNHVTHEASYRMERFAYRHGRPIVKSAVNVGKNVANNTGRAVRNGYNMTIGRGVNKLKGAVVNSRVGRATANAKKAINTRVTNVKNTIKETKLVRKASDWANKFSKKMPAFVKNTVFKSINFVKNFFGGIKEFLLNLLMDILVIVMKILSGLFVFAILLLLIVIIIFLLFSLLASLVNAITGLWGKITTQSQSLVSSNPEFIINQAVNYRNAELDIYNLFVRANAEAKDGKIPKSVMMVSTDPVYHSLYDDNFNLKRLFPWFTRDTFVKDTKNTKAKELIDDMDSYVSELPSPVPSGAKEASKWRLVSKPNVDLMSDVDSYALALLHYYNKESKTGVASEANKSNYEISNAKAAVALVDTLYLDDSETMQKGEVLAYLGVGEYQFATDNSDPEAVENLFWLTHDLNYNEGNMKEDIWFHLTAITSDGNFKVDNSKAYYPLAENTGTKKHSANASVAGNVASTCKCTDIRESTMTIERTVTYVKDVPDNHIGVSDCHNWGPGCSCTHEEKYDKTETKTIDFDVCKGHMVLDARMDVACLEENEELFFELAKEVPKQDATKTYKIFTYDKGQQIFGFGGLETEAYNPAEDWDTATLCGVARTKKETEHEYNITSKKDVTSITMDVYQNKGKIKIKSLSKSNKNNILLNAQIGDKIYHFPSFVDGKQDQVPAYGSDLTTLRKVSTKSVNGIPKIQ